MVRLHRLLRAKPRHSRRAQTKEAPAQTGASFCLPYQATSRKSSVFAMRALSRELGHGPGAADRSDEQSDQEKQ